MFNIRNLLIASAVIALPTSIYTTSNFHTETCGFVFDSERLSLVENINEETATRLRSERSVSADAICEMPISKLSKSLKRLEQPKPDHPGDAARFRFAQLSDKDGNLNTKNWDQARQQVLNAKRFSRRDAGVDRNNWISIGPGNIGGRIRSLAFDPDDSQRIYAGAVAGGVWLTENAGASWQPLDDYMGNLSISTLVFDPNDSNIIYAGTGEGTFNADQVRGLGIFKSIDKGQTWTHLTATADDYDFYWVNRLTILPDSSKIFAATHTGIWKSEDGGTSWTQTHSGRTFDVDAHPTDNNLLIAGTAGNALYSTDGGETWDTATGLVGGSGRVEIAYARGTPTTTYVSVNVSSGEIWKSTDGGQSYTQTSTGTSYLGSQGWYDNALWVDPLDEDHVIVGGIDLWRTTNGGGNLSKISTWWKAPNSAHADHHFVIEHPDYDGTSNKRVYFANDGGVYTAPDVSIANDDTGWQELNNQLTITQFYGMGVAPDGTVVGGTQDNGTLVYKGNSEGWTTTFGGDGGWSAADPTDSNYLYGEYVYLQIHRSTNGGVGYSSSYIFQGANSANFIAPFILDPNNPNRLLGGGDELWVSDNVKDATPSFSAIKSDIGSNISAIAVAPGNSDIIYVGHNDGSLYKTTNGTDANPNWNDITGASMPSRFLMRIAIDPNDADVVYVSFGGYNSNNLWKSTDGGTIWSQSTGTAPSNLPPAPIRTIAIKPDHSNFIYVGTEVGIFASEDSGASWSLENDGPANVSTDELVWGDNDTLYAATHGRGIYRVSISGLSFDTITDVPLSSEQVSNTQTISGLSANTPLSISNGEYSIGCNGTFSSDATTVNNGDEICVRHTSSSEYWTLNITTVSLGSRDFEFRTRTIAGNTPDPVSFDALIDVALGSVQISNTVLISGITDEVPISIVNGDYAINCNGAGFTNLPGQISLGNTLCLRHTASNNYLETVTTTVTIGESSFDFTSTTLPDTVPDSFTFDAVDGVLIDSTQTSNTVTITGYQIPIPVSVSNGEYSIGCGSVFTSSDGQLSPGESICVRHTASSNYLTDTTTTLTIGGVNGNFVSTTSNDITPDNFSFDSVTDVERSTLITSNTVTITGIAEAVDILVNNGEYSIGCNGTFTTSAGTIDNEQTVCVRHTSSSDYVADTTTTLSVGRTSRDFVTTTSNDITPDDFSFDSVTDVERSVLVTSNTITITGIATSVDISVSNGEYSIGCSDTFTASAGTINNGETVCVRHTSSSNYLTDTTTTLTISGVSGDFVSTTSNDIIPDDFSFNSVTDVERNTLVTSNTVTITGVAIPVDISVSNGEYSIGCSGTFTTSAGTIDNDQTVCVRHTSSSNYSSSTSTTLTVSTISQSFQSTTEAEPSPPPPPSSSSGGGSLGFISLLLIAVGYFRRQLN